jgi:hypothetical protein
MLNDRLVRRGIYGHALHRAGNRKTGNDDRRAPKIGGTCAHSGIAPHIHNGNHARASRGDQRPVQYRIDRYFGVDTGADRRQRATQRLNHGGNAGGKIHNEYVVGGLESNQAAVR